MRSISSTGTTPSWISTTPTLARSSASVPAMLGVRFSTASNCRSREQFEEYIASRTGTSVQIGIRNRFKPKMGVASDKSTHLRYRFSGEQKFPSCIAQERKDAWREISRSIRSRIRGGVRLCLSCRKPPHLAFEAIAAFLDRSAAPPARMQEGQVEANPARFAILDS